METIAERLETHYRTHLRILPWRADPTPYHVWLSEIMLQQTRVEAVKPYYLRFLDVLPSIESLAKAKEDVYLKLWEGLGYYSRVKNLHQAAVEIVETYQGEMPKDVESLLLLPGIGDYTANAISAIAFHQKAVAVDGNLLRIYARVFALPLDPKSPKDKKQVKEGWLKQLEGDPAVFNQCLMDIGQNLCLPHGAPHCSDCPLRDCCKAHEERKETSFPLPAPSLKQKEEKRTIILLCQGDLLYLQKRPEKGLLSSLYEPVNLPGDLTEEEVRNFLKKKGYVCLSFTELGHAKHVFSHLIWKMKGYRVEVQGPLNGFVTKEERKKSYSIPSAFSYFLAD